ncbi:MAG TPA: phosphoenolpyruvate--protein phosphotransferase [Candidatus Hydrogenedentes bacterium]|nr:phosphoenolpyruvate--protein phosphotransferase [Candidatus Hydrogenedentota bacterium]
MEIRMQGLGVSPGIAVAPVIVHARGRWHVPVYAISNPEAEIERFHLALESAREDLLRLYAQTTAALGSGHAAIFQAHLMILDDPVFQEEVSELVRSRLCNVEHALDRVSREYLEKMGQLAEFHLQDRHADILDVVDRLMERLLAVQPRRLADIEEPVILVARDLSPSETVGLNRELVQAIVVEVGSVTSHSAILARALQIPAVIGVPSITAKVIPGQFLVVDGSDGTVILDPEPNTQRRYRQERETFLRRQAVYAGDTSRGPAIMADGQAVILQANIELPAEVAHGLRAGATGVGLFRTEYLFLGRNDLPREQEQFEAYLDVVRAANGQPVTIRTLDIGGDKLSSAFSAYHEANPQLGWRAIRYCLAHPELFRAQLRAILRASAFGPVRIMFPLVTGPDEFRRARDFMKQVMLELRDENIPFDANVPVGAMIEVSSAVMTADILARECQFFSIGTNDLIQYSLAVDRVNEKIAHLYDPCHPGVIRMIAQVVNAANARGIECAVCGEMAGDPLYAELLIGLGVLTLSMAPVAIPFVREAISELDTASARQFALQALSIDSSEDIRNLLAQRYTKRTARLNSSPVPETAP